MVPVESADELMSVLHKGIQNGMGNAWYSDPAVTHRIVVINVSTTETDGSSTSTRLYLVDLAGPPIDTPMHRVHHPSKVYGPQNSDD